MSAFIYEIALHLLAIAYLMKRRVWKRVLARLGKGFPVIEKSGRPLIWVHAVSLGETKAITPLIKKLKSLESNPLILLTTASETGFAEGKKIAEVDYRAYLPWDFRYIIRRIVKRVAPDMVILTEGDFWYNFQTAAKNAKAKVYVVNGKISKRSYERLLRFPFMARLLLDTLDLLCVQSEIYSKRFTPLGVPEEKIVVTGNLKLDAFAKEESLGEWGKKLGIEKEDLVMTLGSTHDPEEKILLTAVKELSKRFPQLKVLLVPRHPERFNVVEALLEKEKVSYSRLTKRGADDKSRVILVDMMGNLRKCYQVSHLAFVGGSLTPRVGGHNILEPAFYGVPVLFGPYMHSQPDFLELVHAYSAGQQVKEETLVEVVHRFLEDGELRKRFGQNGLRLIQEGKGALDHTLLALKTCEKKKGHDRIFALSRDGAVVSSLGS